jgi:hypothetical protein
MQKLRAIASSIVVFTLSVALTGCGRNDWKAETYPVTGTVKINGKDAVGAFVTFFADGQAVDVRESLPYGIVKEDGTFVVSTYEFENGAPAGTYRVTVRWLFEPHLAEDRLDGKFGAPERAVTTVTVKEGRNELPAILLDGVKVKTKSTETLFAVPRQM